MLWSLFLLNGLSSKVYLDPQESINLTASFFNRACNTSWCVAVLKNISSTSQMMVCFLAPPSTILLLPFGTFFSLCQSWHCKRIFAPAIKGVAKSFALAAGLQTIPRATSKRLQGPKALAFSLQDSRPKKMRLWFFEGDNGLFMNWRRFIG